MPENSSDGRLDTPLTRSVQKLATKFHIALLKKSGGRIGGRMLGSPVLILTTKGRKSGEWRETPLFYLDDAESPVIVASNGGASTEPAWSLNLRADPHCGVISPGGGRFEAIAREVHGEEKERLWARLVAMYPGYENYREKTTREIPVIRLERTEANTSRGISWNN